jgi:HEAT repeat protein
VTALDLLLVIAAVQAALFVGLLVVIILTRWVRTHRRERLVAPQGEFEHAMQSWMLGNVGADWVLARLARLPPPIALDLVAHYAARIPPDQWRKLAQPLSQAAWARKLRNGAGSRRWTRRLDAARMLAVTAQPGDAAVLIRLLGDPNAAVVISAMAALERVVTPGLVGAALARLATLPKSLQVYLAAVMRRVHGLVPALDKLLSGPRDRAGLEVYADLAGRLADPGLRRSVTALHDHVDQEVRTAVARALGGFPHDETVNVLRLLIADRVWTVRAQAVASLSRLGDTDVGLYREALRDAAWWVRLRGGLALAKAGASGRNALLSAEIGAHVPAREMARFVLGLAPGALAEYQA